MGITINPQIGSAAMNGGFGLVSDVVNFVLGQKAADKNWNRSVAYADRTSDLEYRRFLDQWKREIAYNDPSAQMQRFIQAGLNPNLVYSQGSSASSPSVPGAQGVTPPAVPVPNIRNPMSDVLDARYKQAATKELEGKTELSYAEANRILKMTPVEYDKFKADVDRLRQQISNDEYQTHINQIKERILKKEDENPGYQWYLEDDENGNPIYKDLIDLIMEQQYYDLRSTAKDYENAQIKFMQEIGILEKTNQRMSFENQDLEKWVEVCAEIYKAQGDQAAVLSILADQDRKFYETLGNREGWNMVFKILTALIQGVNAGANIIGARSRR